MVGIAVVAVVLLLANQLNRPAGGGVQQQGAPGAKPPLVINIALASDIDVDPGSIQRFSWSVPQDRTHCHVRGRIEVTSGGNRDIQIFLSTEDDYTNWANGHEARAFLSTDKTTVVNLDTDLNHGGNMVLALSNKFSVFTGKRVQLRDVKALCS